MIFAYWVSGIRETTWKKSNLQMEIQFWSFRMQFLVVSELLTKSNVWPLEADDFPTSMFFSGSSSAPRLTGLRQALTVTWIWNEAASLALQYLSFFKNTEFIDLDCPELTKSWCCVPWAVQSSALAVWKQSLQSCFTQWIKIRFWVFVADLGYLSVSP